jgi:hypothetical protein
LPIRSAKSSVQKPIATALSVVEAKNTTPPAKISLERQRVFPASPMTGSSALPKRPGSARTSPTSA